MRRHTVRTAHCALRTAQPGSCGPQCGHRALVRAITRRSRTGRAALPVPQAASAWQSLCPQPGGPASCCRQHCSLARCSLQQFAHARANLKLKLNIKLKLCCSLLRLEVKLCRAVPLAGPPGPPAGPASALCCGGGVGPLPSGSLRLAPPRHFRIPRPEAAGAGAASSSPRAVGVFSTACSARALRVSMTFIQARDCHGDMLLLLLHAAPCCCLLLLLPLLPQCRSAAVPQCRMRHAVLRVARVLTLAQGLGRGEYCSSFEGGGGPPQARVRRASAPAPGMCRRVTT